MQQAANFFLKLKCVKSELNVADKYTRQSLGLEASISEKNISENSFNRMGPFQWDLMASTANVNKRMDGKPLKFFPRFYDQLAAGVNVFSQDLSDLKGLFCFHQPHDINIFEIFAVTKAFLCGSGATNECFMVQFVASK